MRATSRDSMKIKYLRCTRRTWRPSEMEGYPGGAAGEILFAPQLGLEVHGPQVEVRALVARTALSTAIVAALLAATAAGEAGGEASVCVGEIAVGTTCVGADIDVVATAAAACSALMSSSCSATCRNESCD